jgi:hypothetical protein
VLFQGEYAEKCLFRRAFHRRAPCRLKRLPHDRRRATA